MPLPALSGSLLAVWYDERETTDCVKGNPAVPCYGMWARKSTDNGATWLPEEPFSDVVSPLPGQPDPSIIAEYAGDYDYGSAVLTQHIHSWVDGRKAINGSSQQDSFVDRDLASAGGGGANLVKAACRLTHGSAGSFDINMPLTGTSGVEDRDSNGSYVAVFTFDAPATSANATVVRGTATAGTPTFNGDEMRVRLTGVANEQIVTIRVSNVNGDGGSDDVDFGFLIADADANRIVARPDFDEIKSQIGQPVTAANFRDDVIPDGTISRDDAQTVRVHKGESLP